MQPTDNLIDLARYRKRKQAQQRAQLMWEIYARNAACQAGQWAQAQHGNEPCHG
ncbi:MULTISPECIES: hypothetical protein [unclassified Pseudomonas]|uniref:hypothetical protein n=1 Tax=unclassified Pseudomonas TaxID=196821 RepID=UPI0015B693E2|nr:MULTISPECIES: hypothetical protein [unclassified Pseudomonas]